MSHRKSNPPSNWVDGVQRMGDSDVYLLLGDTPANSIVWHWCVKSSRPRWIGSAISLHTIVTRKPVTITASLACVDGCGWHGHITAGQWLPVAGSPS